MSHMRPGASDRACRTMIGGDGGGPPPGGGSNTCNGDWEQRAPGRVSRRSAMPPDDYDDDDPDPEGEGHDGGEWQSQPATSGREAARLKFPA
eukprot:1963203-Amphidinium_carterae.1